jgi:hypothetical protein
VTLPCGGAIDDRGESAPDLRRCRRELVVADEREQQFGVDGGDLLCSCC